MDGVLTDGRIVLDNQGIESKRFYVRDGLAVKLWQKAGYRLGLLTQRSSQSLKVRATELGIELIRQGIPDKIDRHQADPAGSWACRRAGLLPGR